MADLVGESSQPESNNFDNDFEKLDPFSPESTNTMGDELVTSTSQMQADMPEEDFYRAAPPNPSEAEPLVSFGDTPVPTESPSNITDFIVQKPQPVSSSTEPEPVKPTPVPQPEPAAPSSGSGKPCCAAGTWLEKVDPRVLDLIYWRDIKKSGVVFASIFVVFLSLALFSVLSVAAYLSLAALTVTVSFRVYKNVLGAVQKSGEGHPFKQYLDMEISLPEEKLHELADVFMGHIAGTLRELRRLFLVEDIIDSIKFGLFLWVLTYIGAWFNGMTLIILGFVAVFSLPKVYETYKVQIDQYVDLIKTQVRNIVKQVQEKIPLPGKKKAA